MRARLSAGLFLLLSILAFGQQPPSGPGPGADGPPTELPTPPLADESHASGGAPGKPSSRAITLSDFGAEDLAALAIPSTPPTVGVVLIPDAYGLDDFTRHETERLAGIGYLVVAVDIYNGKQTTDPGQQSNMVANLDATGVMKTIDAGIRLFHESPKFRVDHVVAMGWGVGANFALEAARENKGLDGAILFYGPVPSGHPLKVPVPVCALYSQSDPATSREAVLGFQHAERDLGCDFTAWFIAAGSGWSNPLSKTYNPVEDKEAWKVAEPFIFRVGAEPSRAKSTVVDKVKDKVKSIFDKL